MAEIEIPFEDKVIRLKIDVVSIASKTAPTPAPAPTVRPAVTLRPKV